MARTDSRKTWPALATAIWAILFGGLNLYWTFGGRWLTEFLGASLQQGIADNDQQLMIANTIGGIGKFGLGAVAILTILPAAKRVPHWLMTLVTFGSGVLLVLYGLANWSIVSLAMMNLIDVPSSIGEDQLPWYFWLWEPLWIIGGVLLILTWWDWRKGYRTL